MERVACTIQVTGKMIEIIPTAGVLDNSLYEIRLINIKELNGTKQIEDTKIEVCTAVTPAYCTLDDVKSIIDPETCPVPDNIILYHIRTASKYADYLSPVLIDPQKVLFYVEQFVKYKAAHECILRHYIEQATEGGSKGAMGDVSFELTGTTKDISDLLELLKENIDYWATAVMGYGIEGRAKPASAIRGRFVLPTTPANDNPPKRPIWNTPPIGGGRNL